MNKIVKPINPLIYKVAAEMAGVFYDAGRATGLHSIHKTPEAFAKANIEKFIAKAVETLIAMLKPHSGITEHMRSEIYEALMDPVNDPQLMNGGKVNGLPDLDIEKVIQVYDKINTPISTNKTEKKTILHS